MKKYEITDIAHPDDPTLHRIRALWDIGEDIEAGTLGGYVQCEDNLAQDAGCAWIYGDAVCREGATVQQNAILAETACVEGCALVTGEARVLGNARLRDNAIVTAGLIWDNAVVCGNGCVRANEQTGKAPMLCDNAVVMGTAAGHLVLHSRAFLLPGQMVDNPTIDRLYISEQGATLQHRADKTKKRSEPER